MDSVELIKRVRPSIAKIFRVDAQGNPAGTGSGFVFSKNKIVVTCNHVVTGAHSILVRFDGDASVLVANVILNDQEHDLALLKIEGLQREPLMPGRSEEVSEGMPVLFSGYPLSFDTLTTHQGILSAITVDAVGIRTYLIDGTVNSGNSGCPLLNAQGEVIGVVNAKQREFKQFLDSVEQMPVGALALHGVDVAAIYKALLANVQLGVGYAVPVSYIPDHKEMPPVLPTQNPQRITTSKKK